MAKYKLKKKVKNNLIKLFIIVILLIVGIILIKDYLANNCKMKDVYTKRVDDFYKFTDKNNCKRVYEWIYEN